MLPSISVMAAPAPVGIVPEVVIRLGGTTFLAASISGALIMLII